MTVAKKEIYLEPEERNLPCAPKGIISYIRPQSQMPAPGAPAMPMVPQGPTHAGPASIAPGGGQAVYGEPAPQTVQNPNFLAGFLRRQIGKNVRVEFLIGTNAPLVDRIGTLVDVGANFILIRPTGTDDLLMCDLYAIKFVTIYR